MRHAALNNSTLHVPVVLAGVPIVHIEALHRYGSNNSTRLMWHFQPGMACTIRFAASWQQLQGNRHSDDEAAVVGCMSWRA